MLETLGVRDLVGAGTLDNYGSVSAERALEILSTYVSKFAKSVMDRKAAPGSFAEWRSTEVSGGYGCKEW